jgi:hypothetical protein
MKQAMEFGFSVFIKSTPNSGFPLKIGYCYWFQDFQD